MYCSSVKLSFMVLYKVILDELRISFLDFSLKKVFQFASHKGYDVVILFNQMQSRQMWIYAYYFKYVVVNLKPGFH